MDEQQRKKARTRKIIIAVIAVDVVVLLAIALAIWVMRIMPGESHVGASAADENSSLLAEALKQDVDHLATVLGERNAVKRPALDTAQAYLNGRVTAMGYSVQEQRFQTVERAKGQTFFNLVFERKGTVRPEQVLIIGAHYDSAEGTPGANDNGSGVAAVLQLADAFSQRDVARTLRFVLYANEEPPFFGTDDMGSRHHAKGAGADEKVIGMLSLETLGSFSDEHGSQRYPPPLGLLYPDTGNFIAFVSDLGSRAFLHDVIGSFRKHARVASDGGALPSQVPGVYWSDHWSYWRVGVPALMVTDTAPFRYAHYHEQTDTPDRIDFHRLSLVVMGLARTIDDVAQQRIIAVD